MEEPEIPGKDDISPDIEDCETEDSETEIVVISLKLGLFCL